MASERSERDTYRGKNEKIGDVCLFIYLYIMFGRMYVILYFDPPYFCVRSAFDPVPNFTKQNPLVAGSSISIRVSGGGKLIHYLSQL